MFRRLTPLQSVSGRQAKLDVARGGWHELLWSSHLEGI